MREKIQVTKSTLPPRKEFNDLVDAIWKSHHLTNNGPLLKRFEKEAKSYLGQDRFQFVSNGTIALQIALEALDIRDGEVITTPFTYVATVSSILWQRCTPVFVDIDPETLCIDASKIEKAITKKTKAIMPVHVFGNPCDVTTIGKIAKAHNLKVIYDAAHAFGVTYKGKSLLDHGDISTVSFHATKAFHTIEGGAVIARTSKIDKRLNLIKKFGHLGDDHYTLGINAKPNEFQAAMGVANLKYFKSNVEKRKALSEYYDTLLGDRFQKQKRPDKSDSNYTYYPILLRSEKELKNVEKRLNKIDVYPRRYFYPSLNTLPYLVKTQKCPIAEDISVRILCLPLYVDLKKSQVLEICKVVLDE